MTAEVIPGTVHQTKWFGGRSESVKAPKTSPELEKAEPDEEVSRHIKGTSNDQNWLITIFESDLLKKPAYFFFAITMLYIAGSLAFYPDKNESTASQPPAPKVMPLKSAQCPPSGLYKDVDRVVADKLMEIDMAHIQAIAQEYLKNNPDAYKNGITLLNIQGNFATGHIKNPAFGITINNDGLICLPSAVYFAEKS